LLRAAPAGRRSALGAQQAAVAGGAMESGTTVYTAVEPFDVQAQDLGDTVVLTGSARIRVTSNGNPLNFSVHFTEVYANRGGNWQTVAWQSTRLPE
jgi:hypothetical protein